MTGPRCKLAGQAAGPTADLQRGLTGHGKLAQQEAVICDLTQPPASSRAICRPVSAARPASSAGVVQLATTYLPATTPRT